MSKQRISFAISHDLYAQVCEYAEANEMSASAVIRLAVRKLIQPMQTNIKPAQEPPKKDIDPDKVGADGYTNAQREAILAKAKARADSGEPWEPPPPVPIKPNTVRPLSERDILTEWEG